MGKFFCEYKKDLRPRAVERDGWGKKKSKLRDVINANLVIQVVPALG